MTSVIYYSGLGLGLGSGQIQGRVQLGLWRTESPIRILSVVSTRNHLRYPHAGQGVQGSLCDIAVYTKEGLVKQVHDEAMLIPSQRTFLSSPDFIRGALNGGCRNGLGSRTHSDA